MESIYYNTCCLLVFQICILKNWVKEIGIDALLQFYTKQKYLLGG
jgi:hypothetical protein